MRNTGTASLSTDTRSPHLARMYDAFLGGKDNFQADRDAARKVERAVPETRAIARANRAFLQRAVRFLVGEAGIRQIIDVGTGLPSAGNVHEVARRIAPRTRVVYVDNDRIVNAHANALLAGSRQVGTALADLREPEAILAHPAVREMIDFREPAALLLIAVVHFLTDADDPRGAIAALRDVLAPGSYMALSHGTADFHSAAAVSRATAAYEAAAAPLVLRPRARVAGFFDGFELVQPGLVRAPLWRPDGGPPRPEEITKIAVYGGVGRWLG